MEDDEHYDDDFDVERDDEEEYDCPAYWVDGGWFCPMQGSEECDWSCPHGR